MNVKDLKSKCIEASKFYYDYLEQNNRGIERINITSKNLINSENDTWELHIGKKLFSPDCIKIYNRQYDEYYDLADFTVKEYDADNKLLIIKFTTQTNFGNTPANNLEIISDLKFLIKNVENWYTDNGQKIHFDGRTNVGEDEDECDSYPFPLNANQLKAIKNILRNKYNYVWGPPGTGKTRHVLSAAVLHHLSKNNPKIGIFAPTNNALEQVLSSIIEHLDGLGISRKKLLRIGGPSRKFAEEYPETCEIQGLTEKLEEIKKLIENIKDVMEYRRGQHVSNSVFAIQNDIKKISDLNTQLGPLLVSKSKKQKALKLVLKESNSLIRRLKRALDIDSEDYQPFINHIEKEIFHIENEIAQINTKIEQCFLRVQNIETRSEKIEEIIHTINIQNYSGVAEQLSHASEEINDYLKRKEALSREYSGCNDEELNDLKIEHEKNYKKLEATKIEERIKNCSIIGMTLDGYIGRFSDVQINFSNIFLDEAGYVPLIKALTLFSNRCGITFLGDHKQLPPVCEFDNVNTIPGLYRILWSKPSVFAETILSYDEEDCLNIADNTDCPEFKYIKKSILIESHRFGANLSDLLDKLIYNIGYKSALDDDVDLYFIDAPNPNIRDGRKNANECERIHNILDDYIDEDYCILTPYKDQVSLLQRSLQRARQEERISTIHKSQGREWDTVILSVVDGSTITPWFTDSNHSISQGLYILNTAISRARKKLIIVCDATYWLSRQDAEIQLISNLINISERLRFNEA